MLLDKVIYTEHPLSKKLKDNPVSDYKPNWTKNTSDKTPIKEKTKEKPPKKQKLGWDNF